MPDPSTKSAKLAVAEGPATSVTVPGTAPEIRSGLNNPEKVALVSPAGKVLSVTTGYTSMY